LRWGGEGGMGLEGGEIVGKGGGHVIFCTMDQQCHLDIAAYQ